ncbi:HK97 family phage prohead protease [Mycolicibacterium palauense]|uniref:HK97 family phage prohead protease n=1 Tax=Mycolicibacterium palauense TaxID=2034511 RepID=UPI001FE442D8|nr:HK97 family phage prohead protease [Mycolicibacterium palauense]
MTALLTKPPSSGLWQDNLLRTVPFEIIRADDDTGDGRTFTGYGAVFNEPTRIDSWEGLFDEQIAPGAFRKSLRERTPKFQFDHGRHPLIGSIPIGVIKDIHEDERGLFVRSRLGQHIIIDLVREAIATGAIDGMSFRFSVVRDEWIDVDGNAVKAEDVRRILYYGEQPERAPLIRTLKEVKISEVGPVVWPAYGGTSAEVRSADNPIVLYPDRLHEPEQRKLLAEAVFRAEAVDHEPDEGAPDEGQTSEDEPRDTADGAAVEHSVDDTESPQSTSRDEAGEHEEDTETDSATDEPDEDRAGDDALFGDALKEVRGALDLNPPMKGF